MIEAASVVKRSFNYGKKSIGYSLFYTERKTLEIAVHPDRTVVIKAPHDSEISIVERKLLKRARWILKQLNYFRQFHPKTPERKYVSGEAHLYLGRQYRLRITHSQKDSVKLTKGFFQVDCRKGREPEPVKKLMTKWYSTKANIQFNDSIDRCWRSFDSLNQPRPTLSIRPMKKRWGSLSEKGTLTLNKELVKAPKECIDYVVTHELCHIKYHDHSPEFYKLLESVIPNWEKIKHKLELSMA